LWEFAFRHNVEKARAVPTFGAEFGTPYLADASGVRSRDSDTRNHQRKSSFHLIRHLRALLKTEIAAA
jgi:hypothetical protein